MALGMEITVGVRTILAVAFAAFLAALQTILMR
jgi:hypothetical protein